MTISDYTTNETIVLDVLSDGDRHRTHEIGERIDAELPPDRDAIRRTVARLRVKLQVQGETIVCEYRERKYYYRHVRLITSGQS